MMTLRKARAVQIFALIAALAGLVCSFIADVGPSFPASMGFVVGTIFTRVLALFGYEKLFVLNKEQISLD